VAACFVWIWGIWAGYTKKMLLHSKSIVYSAGMSFPVFVIYNMYYIVSSSILKNNYNVKVTLVNSVLLSFVMLHYDDAVSDIQKANFCCNYITVNSGICTVYNIWSCY